MAVNLLHCHSRFPRYPYTMLIRTPPTNADWTKSRTPWFAGSCQRGVLSMSLRMSKYERFRTGSINSPENLFITVRRRNYFRLSYLILQSSQLKNNGKPTKKLLTFSHRMSKQVIVAGVAGTAYSRSCLYLVCEVAKVKQFKRERSCNQRFCCQIFRGFNWDSRRWRA